MENEPFTVTLLGGPFDGRTWDLPGASPFTAVPHEGKYYLYEAFEDADRSFDDPIRMRWNGEVIEMTDLPRILQERQQGGEAAE